MQLDALHAAGLLAAADFAFFLAWMGPGRRARIAHFRRPEDAHRSLLGEALMRAVAARRLGIAPQDVRFVATPEGKPGLADFPDCHLNLSHGGEWVVCASGPRAVGVDVEAIMPVPPELPPEVCSPEELQALTGSDIDERFARLWTVKEAYAKALGVGLGMDFRRLEVRPAGGVDLLLQDGCLLPDVAVSSFGPDARHRGAVCVLGGHPPKNLCVRDLAWLRQAGGEGP